MHYPLIGNVVRIYDLRIVDVFCSVWGHCNRQVMAFNGLHLQAVFQIWAVVHLALDKVIRFEIEKYVGGKGAEVNGRAIR